MATQTIGKNKNGWTVCIEVHKNSDSNWGWKVIKDPMRGAFGGVAMCPYQGGAKDEQAAIEAAKKAAVEDPGGYIGWE